MESLPNVPLCYLALFSDCYIECSWLLSFSCVSERPSVKLKTVYLGYVQQRILFHCRSGENLQQFMQSLAMFLIYYDETGTIAHAPGIDQKSKMTAEVKQIIEEQIERNDETIGEGFAEVTG